MPPLRRIWKRFLLFRRGRTLAGPPKGYCHSGAHPHPPRIRSAPSPWKGEGFRAANSRPYGESGSDSFFFVGAGHWPARRRATAIPEPTLIRLAYARHLLPGREKVFGRLIDAPTADTEAVSFSRRGRSQTGPRAATWGRPYRSQKIFRVWVGEDLGPPAVNGPGAVCSVNPGAGMEPRNLKFLLTQAPVGREMRRKATQILRAGNIAGPDRYASPGMGAGERRL